MGRSGEARGYRCFGTRLRPGEPILDSNTRVYFRGTYGMRIAYSVADERPDGPAPEDEYDRRAATFRFRMD